MEQLSGQHGTGGSTVKREANVGRSIGRAGQRGAARKALAPAAALILATLLNADYGWKGVLLFIVLYAVRDNRPGIAAVMVSYFLFYGSFFSVTKSLFGWNFDVNSLDPSLSKPLSSLLRMETYALLSLPFILIRFKKDLKLPRWVGYALYPAHLALLYGLEQIIK